jgi:hypothetical protein
MKATAGYVNRHLPGNTRENNGKVQYSREVGQDSKEVPSEYRATALLHMIVSIYNFDVRF